MCLGVDDAVSRSDGKSKDDLLFLNCKSFKPDVDCKRSYDSRATTTGLRGALAIAFTIA